MTADAPTSLTAAELADLLMETGQHHHRAYIDADGTDPEWALWYAGYLQSRIWDRGGFLPTRSQLVHLLLSAEREHAATGGDTPWPPFYAELMLPALTSS